MTLSAGILLGADELVSPLGAAGMGEVYRGKDTGKVTLLPWMPQGSYVLDYPSWSPDGKKVYFSVSRKTGDIYELEGF